MYHRNLWPIFALVRCPHVAKPSHPCSLMSLIFLPNYSQESLVPDAIKNTPGPTQESWHHKKCMQSINGLVRISINHAGLGHCHILRGDARIA